jgi:hypothetical protein
LDCPVFLDGIPELQQTLLVGVAILYDQRLNALRMPQREAVAHRRAVVEDIERVAFEPKLFDQLFHNVSQGLESVGEALMIRRAALAEAGIVGRHHVE